MKGYRKLSRGLLLTPLLAVLIIESKTTTAGVLDGIKLCIHSVIPALYPYLVLIPLICQEFAGKPIGFLKPIGRLCKLPSGAETIMLFGMLGGYPTGAALVAEAYRNKQLSKADARRMMGFCSNAGPAFIFGMIGPLFENPAIAWILWLIHMLSAIIVGFCTREDTGKSFQFYISEKTTIVKQIEKSTKTMAIICAWVILFRLVSCLLGKWLLYYLPYELQVITVGILELSNGCLMLKTCISEAVKFLICSVLLGFGGVCVMLQTESVCDQLGMGNYFPGKLFQSAVSLLFALLTLPVITKIDIRYSLISVCVFLIAIIVCNILMKNRKKLWQNAVI